DLANEGDNQALAHGFRLQPGDTVEIEERKLKPIYVIGMVNKPGEYKIPHDFEMRLLDAIGLAGGVDRTTGPEQGVGIRRNPETGESVAVRIDLDQAKKDTKYNLPLMAGDIVSVEETFRSFTRGLIRGAFHIGIGATLAPSLAY